MTAAPELSPFAAYLAGIATGLAAAFAALMLLESSLGRATRLP